MRVYQIIEKNREWYEDLLNNKISDQQFTVSSCVLEFLFEVDSSCKTNSENIRFMQ